MAEPVVPAPPGGQDAEARLRLVRAELHPFPGGGTLVIAPGGRMFHVAAPPEAVQKVLLRLNGGESVESVLRDTDRPDGFREVLETLHAAGCLTTLPARPHDADWVRFGLEGVDPARVERTTLLLTGDTRLIALVRGAGLTNRFGAVQEVCRETLASELAGRPAVGRQQAGAPSGSGEHSAGLHVVVAVLLQYLDQDFLLQVDRLCEQHGLPWTQFHLENGRGWLGPAILPGRTASYHDLLVRRLCNADDEQVHAALMTPPVSTDTYLPPTAELLWMLGLFFADLERWVAGAPCRTLSTELEADPVIWSLTPYPVLPLPHRQLTGEFLCSVPCNPDILVNERSGVIIRLRHVEHHPSVPPNLTTVQAHVSAMARFYPWTNDMICGGSHFTSETTVRDAAIGEAVERYCGNLIDVGRLKKASYNDLVRSGEYALDPEQLILFSDRIYNAPGCPFVRFTRDLPVYWVQGQSLTRNRPAWLPVSLVYVNWRQGELAEEPLTNYLYFPGIAAGPNLETALVSAIEEVVERDITMVWWMNRHALPAVQLTPELERLWEGKPQAMGQRAWLIHLDNEFDVPVMAGVLENVVEGWFNIGFACRHDPVQAALKAWAEALVLQEGSRDLDDPNGLQRQAVEWGILPRDVFKPWRKDRRYMDDYRSDYRDVADLLSQQQFFLDPRAREAVRPWTDVPATRRLTDLPRLPERSVRVYRERIEARGYEIFYADLTTPDVALSGLRVVRVIIPGLVPNFPAAFPPTGGGRVQNLPVQLGWRATPIPEEQLNYMPLPHA